jgi:2'-5' RNA ligase
MSKIRTFVAIPLNQDIISRIEKIHEELRSIPADVKWVRPKSIHLTLKFLGNIDEGGIDSIAQAIQNGVRTFQSWPVYIKNVGAFPSLRNPRVVWIGIEDKSGKIITLQNQIEKELSRLGFEKEKRRFSPHLTLGRVKSPRGKRDLILYLSDEREREFGETQIDRVVLFRSDLKPSGAVYTVLREFNF